MRNKKFLIFLLLFGGSAQQLVASRSADANTGLMPGMMSEKDKREIELELADVSEKLKETGLSDQDRTILEVLQNIDSRAISQTTVASTAGVNNIEFGKGIYDGSTNKLWTFAAANGGNKGAIGNFVANRVVGGDTITFTPAAPSSVTLNAVPAQPNPISNKKIFQAALCGSSNLPVVVYENGRRIVSLSNAAGSTLFTNVEPIRDAAPVFAAAVCSPAVAIAGDHLSATPFIIAAVPQGGPATIATPILMDREGYVTAPLTTMTNGLVDRFTAATKPLASAAVATLAADNGFVNALTTVVSDAVSFAKMSSADDISSPTNATQAIANVMREILFDLTNLDGKIPSAVAVATMGGVTAANIVSAFSTPFGLPVMTAIAGTVKHAGLADISAQLATIITLIVPDSAHGGADAAILASVGWAVNQIYFDPVFALTNGECPFPWGTGDADGNGAADGTNRGFAILQNNGTTMLVQKDPDNVTLDKAQSALLDLEAKSDATPANITVAFHDQGAPLFIDTAAMASDQGGDNAFMWRDESTNRYFIGLQNVSRGVSNTMTGAIGVSTSADGGVIAALVAGITNNAFSVNPILANPVHTAFATTDDKAIIGFYRTAGDSEDYRANIYRACPMHTSTGRDYIIINGGVVTYDPVRNPTLTEVYALPIMPGTDTTHAGQLAKTNGTGAFTLLVAGTDPLITVNRSHSSPNFGTVNPFTAAERKAVVGADPRYLDPTQVGVAIQDMYIVGDSVVIAVAGDRGACEKEAGIFQSTALFDQNGLICGFTPWQRVGQAQADAAYAVGFDVKTGNYMYLTTNDLSPIC